ncbi:MAG: hypothetical protein R3F29_03525 [Planctomycetota bacterium]
MNVPSSDLARSASAAALDAKVCFRSDELRPAPRNVTDPVEIIPSSELKRPICRFPERAVELVEQLLNCS